MEVTSPGLRTLNTNPRGIYSNNNGFFVKSGCICNKCGNFLCCTRQEIPTGCRNFSPILSFRSPVVGLDGEFNTFRLGELAYGRFSQHVGTIFTLFDKSKGRVVGRAKLIGCARGDLKSVLDRFAHSNHLAIGKGVGRDRASAWLGEVLERNYKVMFKTPDHNDPFTVLFFERCKELEIEGVKRRSPGC